MARKPTLTALYSKRRTIDFPFFRDNEKQREHLIRNEINYIILDGMFAETYVYLAPYIKEKPQSFQLIARIGKAYLLRVGKEAL
jgi:hypothetical protein